MPILSDDLVTELKESYTPSIRHRTKKVNLVLLGGKAGAGKTTAAIYILDKLISYSSLVTELIPLAKPIKILAEEWFKWDGKKDDKGRRLLQVLGTDAGRAYNENLWVEHLDNSILGTVFIPHFVLVDDWRFPNEASYFENNFMYEVTKIRIERDTILNGKQSSHLSENAIPAAEFEHLERVTADSNYDFAVFNNSTIEDFYKKLDSVISYLETKIITY